MEYEIRFYYSKNKKNDILNKLDKINKIKNVGTFYEKTTQYNSILPGNDFYSKEIDGRYRIRITKGENVSKCMLSWKRRLSDTKDGLINKEEEIECNIDPNDYENFIYLTEKILKMKRVESYERYRTNYVNDNIIISVDEYPFGIALEIEAKTSTNQESIIDEYMKLLDLNFDLVGVLVSEKDIELSEVEEKLERMFGPNLNDEDYLKQAKKIVEKDLEVINTTKVLINKLYKVKDKKIFKKINEINENVKIIIATNHLSFVKDFIKESFNIDYLDDIIISAEIHKIKPNLDFYQYILNKYSIESKELLFLDDNINNINGAQALGINTIKIEKDTNLIDEISKFIC